MDHGHMDHGHMGHGGMDMGGHTCNMNMIFTWDTTDLCIIFHWWHVSGPLSLFLSLVGVVLLTAGYEGIREVSRRFELQSAEGLTRLPPDGDADDSTKPSSWIARLGQNQKVQENRDKTIKALLYAVQVFYSFLIMLLFMTYNGYVMLAVAVGAFVGFIAFGQGSATKTVACH